MRRSRGAKKGGGGGASRGFKGRQSRLFPRRRIQTGCRRIQWPPPDPPPFHSHCCGCIAPQFFYFSIFFSIHQCQRLSVGPVVSSVYFVWAPSQRSWGAPTKYATPSMDHVSMLSVNMPPHHGIKRGPMAVFPLPCDPPAVPPTIPFTTPPCHAFTPPTPARGKETMGCQAEPPLRATPPTLAPSPPTQCSSRPGS